MTSLSKLEKYIANHEESTLDSVINRKLNNSNVSKPEHSLLDARIVSHYKYHSNRPQKTRLMLSNIEKKASHNVSLKNEKRISLSMKESSDLASKNKPLPAPLGIGQSYISLEKELEAFSLHLNSLKTQRSIQIKQIHQLLMIDIALEDTLNTDFFIEDRKIDVDVEFDQFIAVGQSFLHQEQLPDDNSIFLNDTERKKSTDKNSHKTVLLEHLLNELDAEKQRLSSSTSSTLDSLLGFQSD